MQTKKKWFGLVGKPKKRLESRCSFCEQKWHTETIRSPYMCPDCEEKQSKGQISGAKNTLYKAWRKRGLL